MASKENAVKQYIVTLSDEGARAAHHPYPQRETSAQKLLKARILLQADASQGGEGGSDGQIATSLETSVDTVARARQRL